MRLNHLRALAVGVTSPQPKSDISDFGQLMVPNSGKPEFGWGEVRSRLRDPGEGARPPNRTAAPSPGMCAQGAPIPTSPLRGEVKSGCVNFVGNALVCITSPRSPTAFRLSTRRNRTSSVLHDTTPSSPAGDSAQPPNPRPLLIRFSP